MTRFRRIPWLGLVVTLGFAGCRTTDTAPLPSPTPTPPPGMAATTYGPGLGGAEQVAAPLPDGAYSIPNFGARPATAASGATQVAAADCVEPEKPKRGWRQWLPTTDHSNDPRRERGQTTDGWYEPEFRGISD